MFYQNLKMSITNYPMKYEESNYVIGKCVNRFKNLIYSDSNVDLSKITEKF